MIIQEYNVMTRLDRATSSFVFATRIIKGKSPEKLRAFGSYDPSLRVISRSLDLDPYYFFSSLTSVRSLERNNDSNETSVNRSINRSIEEAETQRSTDEVRSVEAGSGSEATRHRGWSRRSKLRPLRERGAAGS